LVKTGGNAGNPIGDCLAAKAVGEEKRHAAIGAGGDELEFTRTVNAVARFLLPSDAIIKGHIGPDASVQKLCQG
jgi:hypothetical protein